MWQPRVLDTKALGAASFAHPLFKVRAYACLILQTWLGAGHFIFLEVGGDFSQRLQAVCALSYFADRGWGWPFYIPGGWRLRLEVASPCNLIKWPAPTCVCTMNLTMLAGAVWPCMPHSSFNPTFRNISAAPVCSFQAFLACHFLLQPCLIAVKIF